MLAAACVFLIAINIVLITGIILRLRIDTKSRIAFHKQLELMREDLAIINRNLESLEICKKFLFLLDPDD